MVTWQKKKKIKVLHLNFTNIISYQDITVSNFEVNSISCLESTGSAHNIALSAWCFLSLSYKSLNNTAWNDQFFMTYVLLQM